MALEGLTLRCPRSAWRSLSSVSDGDGGVVDFLHLFCPGDSSSGTGGKDESRQQRRPFDVEALLIVRVWTEKPLSY